MDTTSHPIASYQYTQSETRPDVVTELARHRFDLRIYSLIMLVSTVLAGYCGIRIMDFGSATVSGQSVSFGAPLDLLSICGLSVFTLIACLCLLEARRGWLKF
jgi:hypothetical protein